MLTNELHGHYTP